MKPPQAFNFSSIDFTMCNPPFYSSASELLASAAAKSRPPHSACTGAEVEMVVPGGEVAFVSRLIDESLVLKEKVQWYTSMLGKASSISEVVERLKTVGADNWAVTEFVQGQKTRRWAVGWSWGDMRPRQVSEDSSITACVLTFGLIFGPRLNWFKEIVRHSRES